MAAKGVTLPTTGAGSIDGWNTTNIKALNALHECCHNDVVSHIVHCTTAIEAWLQLQAICGSINIIT